MLRRQSIILCTLLGCCVSGLLAVLTLAGPVGTHLAARSADMVRAPTEDVLIARPEGESGGGMIIQVSVPDPEIEEYHESGRLFHKIRLKGYGYTSQVGRPQMPAKGFLLAVPEGSTLRVEVLETEATRASGYRVYPVPKPVALDNPEQTAEEFCVDSDAYSQDRYYPGKLAEVGFYGYIRDVRVAQLRVFPVQFNPSKKHLVFHKRIWLKVILTGGDFPELCNSISRPAGDDPFDALYSNLVLNYNPSYTGTGNWGLSTQILGTDLDYLRRYPYKISIEEDGLYEIASRDLMDAGAWVKGIDPRTIKMFNMGEEIAICVSGEDDGVFNNTDRIEFFAQAGKSDHSLSNTYWLSWGGSHGLRMEERDCAPNDSLTATTMLRQSIHFEEDHEYYASVYEGHGKDHWFWDELAPCCPRDCPILVPRVSSVSDNVHLTLNLRGKGSISHHLQVYLSDHLLGDIMWDGRAEFEKVFAFPQTSLTSGENRLRIEYTSSQWDRVFLNWVEVEYQRDLAAYDDCIRFDHSESEQKQFVVAGFSGGATRLLKICDPMRPVRLTGYSLARESSKYNLTFEADAGPAEYLVLTTSELKKPKSIVPDETSALRSPGNQADYIMITHEDFYDAIQPLKGLREAEGLNVELVKITDIYDEFGYGNVGPQAVKDFLSYAYHTWQEPSPSYVLLVGDASYDYRGNIPDGKRSYVPTHLFMTQTDHLESCGDTWFSCVAGDDMLPDMLIGRLPAETPADIEAMVEKIISYETAILDGDWRQKVLLVADDPDHGGDFEAVADRFADHYMEPAGFQTAKAYVSECREICRDQVLAGISEGCAICNYIGHGAIDLWAMEEIFQSGDVSLLSNGSKLPLMVAFTCFNGLFHHATADCLAEVVVREPGKGAIACWCHSAFNYTSPSDIVGGYLYDALLNDGNYMLGSAINQAKIEYLMTSPYFWDQAEMLVLFGDPALEMGFPGKPDVLPGYIAFDPARPVSGSRDTLEVAVFNAGREDASDVLVRFTCGHPESSGMSVIDEVIIPQVTAGRNEPATVVWDSVPAPGSHCIFVEVDPMNEVLESSEWNNILWDTLVVCSSGDAQDITPPTVHLRIDAKSAGGEFQNHDYVSTTPVIEATLTDCGTGIDANHIRITLDQKIVEDYDLQCNGSTSDSVIVQCEFGYLPDGTHTFSVGTQDLSCSPNRVEASVVFVVASDLIVRGGANFPNPAPGQTTFAYSLSQDADDVSIEIYSVTGRVINMLAQFPYQRNQNTLTRNCRDHNGRTVASGVYFYRLTATKGSESVNHTDKLLLIHQ